MEFVCLSQCAIFSKARTSNFDLTNYISTENMLPNKGGVETSEKLPDAKTVSKYEPGDILLSNIRPYFRKIWFATKAGGCSNDVLVLKVKKGWNSKFIYYVLSDPNFFNYSTVTSKGTKMPRGTPSAILKYPIPSLVESDQELFVSLIGRYDDLIELKNREIMALEKMIEEIYLEWFVRLRYPGNQNCERTRGIPETWTMEKFGDIIQYSRGVSYTSEEIETEEGELLVNLKNINAHGGFRRDGYKRFSGKYKKSQSVSFMDLIMGVTDMTQERRTVGSVALVPNIDGVISADLVKLSSKISNTYLYCAFRYGGYSKSFAQFGNGANVIHLKLASLKNQKIIVPDSQLLRSFDLLINPMIEEIENINDQIENLIAQRESLLPRLISGEFDLKNNGGR